MIAIVVSWIDSKNWEKEIDNKRDRNPDKCSG